MKKLLLTFWLHLFCLVNDSVGISGPMCDPLTYAIPYVRILKKRNGPHIATLERSGFMDLTKYTHKILCMNGPAVMYTELTFPGDGNETRIFTNASLKVHTHECFIINQISTTKAIELRDAGVGNPTLFDVKTKDIMGIKATGIYLISEPLDYYLTTSVMFRQRKWNYIVTPDDAVRDGSFVTLGKGPFCLTMNDKLDIILKANELKETSLCKWTLDLNNVTAKFKKRYEIIFNGNTPRQNISWRGCGSSGGGGDGIGPYPNGLPTTTPPPVIISYDPFAIIDPKFWTALGSKKLRRGNNTNMPNDTESDNIPEDELLEDFIIMLDPKLCIELPPKPDPAKLPAGCINSTAEPCAILERVLMIEDPATKDKTTLVEDLEWKTEILDVTSEIFGKICEPFTPDMPFTVSRVLEYYLARAHSKSANIPKEKKDVWKFLIAELTRCNKGAKKPMLWYWDNQEEMLPPDIRPPVDCIVDSCSEEDACYISLDKKKCEFNTTIPCSTAIPECADNCTYNPTNRTCVSDNATCPLPPGCSLFQCDFVAETGSCENSKCTVSTCTPEQYCKPTFYADSCEDKATPPGYHGAYPSTLPVMPTDKDDEGNIAGQALNPSSLTSPFLKSFTQEVIHPRSSRSYDFNGYPINVLVITSISKAKPPKGRAMGTINDNVNNNTNITGECLFFYEDMAEADFELNIAIDIYWKIWATVIGYCNLFYQVRKSETFPRLYNTFYEDFLEPIVEDWKYPQENEALRIIMSDFNSERSQRWLDVCLESSYIVSNSSTYRPPRPLTIGNDDTPQSNYFLQIPDYIHAKYHNIDMTQENETLQCP